MLITLVPIRSAHVTTTSNYSQPGHLNSLRTFLSRAMPRHDHLDPQEWRNIHHNSSLNGALLRPLQGNCVPGQQPLPDA